MITEGVIVMIPYSAIRVKRIATPALTSSSNVR
jgi:hypothetical protein